MQTPEEKKAALRAPLLEEKAGIERKIAALEAQIKGSSSPMVKRSTTSGSDVGSPEPMDMAAEARLDLEDEKEKLLDVNTRLNKYAGRRRRKSRRRGGSDSGELQGFRAFENIIPQLEKDNRDMVPVANILANIENGIQNVPVSPADVVPPPGTVPSWVHDKINDIRGQLAGPPRAGISPRMRLAGLLTGLRDLFAMWREDEGPGLRPAAPRHGGRRRTRGTRRR
jgi:hypothetical protein